ncbi:MAG: hypothetical protein F7C36_07495 [Desulfurococcales archaeon]|nr:hypothetical protein [Desulfurococcales archaeon]
MKYKHKGALGILLLVIIVLSIAPSTSFIGTTQTTTSTQEGSITHSPPGLDVEIQSQYLYSAIYYGRIEGLAAVPLIDLDSDIMYLNDFGIYDGNYSSYAIVDSGDFDWNEYMETINRTDTYAIQHTGYESGTGLVVKREFVMLSEAPLLIVKTTIINNGTQSYMDMLYEEYMDLDIAGASGDYILAPLGDQITRLTVETFLSRDQFSEPWLLQIDQSTGYPMGIIIGSYDLFNGAYVAYYHGEDPPERINLNSEVITTGDIVVGLTWKLSLEPGDQVTYIYAYAYTNSTAMLSNLASLLPGFGQLTAELDAPLSAYWDQTIPLSFNITNTNKENLTYEVTTELEYESMFLDPQLAPPLTEQFTLAPGESYTNTYLFQVLHEVGTTKVSLYISYLAYNETGALVGNYTIKRTSYIKISPSPYQYAIFSAGEATPDEPAILSHELPSSLLYETTTVTISTKPTVIYISEIKDLIAYPYGCAEQRTSKLLASLNAILYLSYYEDAITEEEYQEYAQIVIGGALELVDLQKPDGGWGWFPEYDSTPFFTAYVLEGLVKTAEWAFDNSIYLPVSTGGNTIPGAMYNASQYFINTQDPDGGWTPVSPDYVDDRIELTAYILYTLSLTYHNLQNYGYSEPFDIAVIDNATTFLLSNQLDDGSWGPESSATGDPYITALVMIALAQVPGITPNSTLQTLVNNALSSSADWLVNNGVSDGETIYWTSTSYGWSHSTEVTTAYAIQALYYVQGWTDTTNQGLAWLIQNAENWLHSTTRTGAVVVGTLQMLRHYSMTTTPVSLVLYLNNQAIWSGSLAPGEKVTLHPDLAIGNNTFELEVTSSEGSAYITVETYYWTTTTLAPVKGERLDNNKVSLQGEGLSLTWNIEEQNPDGSIPSTILISSAQPLYYLVLEIPVPAGYSIDLDTLRQQGYAVEDHGALVAVAIEQLQSGTTSIQVLLKPLVEDITLQEVIPARISEMYNPDNYAYSQVNLAGTGEESTATSPPAQQTQTSEQTGETQTETTSESETSPTQGIPTTYIIAAIAIILILIKLIKRR